MFRHCIHCNASLGDNEAVEALPIGRRLAFDGTKGRLWVVCRARARWNLVPFEQRWEALEECERAFRGTRLRRSTDNIGLATLRDGTELVRIGAPLRPEFAAWRYGSRFAARWVRAEALRWTKLGLAATGALGLVLTGSGLVAWQMVAHIGAQFARGDAEDAVLQPVTSRLFDTRLVRVTVADGTTYEVNTDLVRRTRLAVVDGSPRLHLPDPGAPTRRWLEWTGDGVVPTLRRLLPIVNGGGGAESTVGAAIIVASAHPDPVELLARSTRADWTPPPIDPDDDHLAAMRHGTLAALPGAGRGTPLIALPATRRLALEMALHEDDERRWLDGELHELERHWREAEEVAAIADRLLLPAVITRHVAALRARRRDDLDRAR